MSIYLSIIVPVFNEEKAVKDTLVSIKKNMIQNKKPFEIIAVDDGSTDNSAKIIRKIKGIKLIQHDRNKGYGASLKTGILSSKGKWIFIMDADGTYPAKAIPKFLDKTPEYDMIVGARKRDNIPLLRRPAKWFLRNLANYLCSTKIPDLNSGMRIFKKDIAIRFMSLFPDGFSFTTTLTIASLTNNYSVLFIPIDYYKRRGKSSIHPIKDFLNFVNLVIRLVLYFKPLNIFLPFSAFLFLLGFIKAMRDFLLYNWFGAGAVMIILTAVQIAILGLVADLIVKRTQL